MSQFGKSRRGWVLYALLLTPLLAALGYGALWSWPYHGGPFHERPQGPPPRTPSWALEPWLWEDDVNTAARVEELLAGYELHDIPVRTVLIDSPWSTRYNDFNVDRERYPDRFFEDLEARGYRVVLWMTPHVNRRNDDTAIRDSTAWYEQARERGHLVGDGSTHTWWKGEGGLIDYTDPQALAWWRELQQPLFDRGIDGWKLDGGATYFSWRLGGLRLPYQRTYSGPMTTRGYMDRYYRDEYAHGLTQNPEFVTLARAAIGGRHPEGFAPIDAAPVTWVGDQQHSWSAEDEGIEEAIRDILRSARLGYGVIGSDIGGFGGPEIPADLYIRWAQLSAFCGLFLNGGHGERALWKRTAQELEIVREFAWLHTELVPYIHSHLVAAHEGGPPLMRPAGGRYQYLFGDDLLVAPIYEDRLEREVVLPVGRWRYLFDDLQPVLGPVTFTRDYPLDEYPVYVREGAILPLNVRRSYTGFGDEDSAGYLTLVIYPGTDERTTVHDPEGAGVIEVGVTREADGLRITLDGETPPHILRLLLAAPPREVTLDGQLLTEGRDWSYDPGRPRLVVRTTTHGAGLYRIAGVF